MKLGESTLDHAWRPVVTSHGGKTYGNKVYATIEEAHRVALAMMAAGSAYHATTQRCDRMVRCFDGNERPSELELA